VLVCAVRATATREEADAMSLIPPAAIPVSACLHLPACGGGGGRGGEDGGGDAEPADATEDANGDFAPIVCHEAPAADVGAGTVSGRVVRAEDSTPLFGAVVRLEGVEGCVKSDGASAFSIPVAGGGAYHVVVRSTGRTHARRVGSVASGHHTFVGTLELRRLDPAVTVVGPEGGTHTRGAGGVRLTLPAGALTESVEVRATRFEKGAELPAPMPKTSHFTMAIAAAADGAARDLAVEFAFPNDHGFPPGTPVPAGSLDEAAGKWVPAGMGVVSEDGSSGLCDAAHLASYASGPSVGLVRSRRPGRRQGAGGVTCTPSSSGLLATAAHAPCRPAGCG
jgi:hypothetical protein